MKICFIDLEITFLLSVMRNLAHLALAGNRRSVSTYTLYIYLLSISMGVELLLIILVRACQSLSGDSIVRVSARSFWRYANTQTNKK